MLYVSVWVLDSVMFTAQDPIMVVKIVIIAVAPVTRLNNSLVKIIKMKCVRLIDDMDRRALLSRINGSSGSRAICTTGQSIL